MAVDSLRTDLIRDAGSAKFHHGPRHSPIFGGGEVAIFSSATPVWTCQSNATSSIDRATSPSVSKLQLKYLKPARLMIPNDGRIPTTPL